MISAEAGDWLKKHRRENPPPSWVHERQDDHSDPWKPDDRADDLSRRFEEQHGAYDPEERVA